MAFPLQNLGLPNADLFGGRTMGIPPTLQGAPDCQQQQEAQVQQLVQAIMLVLLQLVSGSMGAPGGTALPGSREGSVGGPGGGYVPASGSAGGLPTYGPPGNPAGAEAVSPEGPTLLGDSQPNASGYAFPVKGYNDKIQLHHGSHPGAADLFAPRGTPVVAMTSGQVVKVGGEGAGGNSVTIKGDDGRMYYYAHLNETPMARQGQQVNAGQQLGGVGDSGNAKGTGTHLHLGIGDEILNGTGPAGGAGSNFNATDFLWSILRNGSG